MQRDQRRQVAVAAVAAAAKRAVTIGDPEGEIVVGIEVVVENAGPAVVEAEMTETRGAAGADDRSALAGTKTVMPLGKHSNPKSRSRSVTPREKQSGRSVISESSFWVPSNS
jgi:hypothetical protein